MAALVFVGASSSPGASSEARHSEPSDVLVDPLLKWRQICALASVEKNQIRASLRVSKMQTSKSDTPCSLYG